MKRILVIVVILAMAIGCGKNHSVTVPKPDSTTTITKTTKTTQLQPVLEKKAVITTQTVTLDANGKPLPPDAALHKAEVKTETPKP